MTFRTFSRSTPRSWPETNDGKPSEAALMIFKTTLESISTSVVVAGAVGNLGACVGAGLAL